MSRFLALAPLLLLAACGAPAADTRPAVAPPAAAASVQTSGALLGISSAAALTRLGTPTLRVTEGSGTMLQWRGTACVLDAYFYPGPNGETATHVDARDATGREVNREACIAALEAAR